MQVFESVKIGTYEIWLHKLRSLLTMMGVIFGVAAVISTAAIGAGARDELNRQLAMLGTNTVRVQTVELRGKEASEAQRMNPNGLTRADLENIRSVLGNEVLAAAPIKETTAQVSVSGRVLPFTVLGTNEDFPAISGFGVSLGRFLNPLDTDESLKVAVIGERVRRDAFPLVDPRGQQLNIAGQSYTVVGVMAARGDSQGGNGYRRGRRGSFHLHSH